MCLQIINRCHALLPHPPTAFFVHPYTELVLIGATQLGALEPLDVDDREQLLKEKALSHEMPLCSALYNENFNQVRANDSCSTETHSSVGGSGGSQNPAPSPTPPVLFKINCMVEPSSLFGVV